MNEAKKDPLSLCWVCGQYNGHEAKCHAAPAKNEAGTVLERSGFTSGQRVIYIEGTEKFVRDKVEELLSSFYGYCPICEVKPKETSSGTWTATVSRLTSCE